MTDIKKQMNERALVSALKQDDPHAFSVLYKMYYESVKAIIGRMIYDEEVVEDIIQETMIKVWKSVDHYDARKGKLFTWVINVARHRALDVIRSKNMRVKRNTYDIDEYYEVIDCMQSLKYNPDQIGIREVAAKLKPKLYEAIDTVYFRDHTHTEAAEIMNIPLGTLKTRIRMALEELRKIFKYYRPDNELEIFSLYSFNIKNAVNDLKEFRQTQETETDPVPVTVYEPEWSQFFSAVYDKSLTNREVGVKRNDSLAKAGSIIRMPLTVTKTNTYSNP